MAYVLGWALPFSESENGQELVLLANFSELCSSLEFVLWILVF